MSDLINRSTRGLFRDLMTNSTVGAISTAFQDEGFPPNPDCTYDDTSVRRTTTQEYFEAVDWSDPAHISRVLRVFERLLQGWDPQYGRGFYNALRRDGYSVDEETGHISLTGPRFSIAALANLTDPSAIRQQLARIQTAVIDDPALAIGSAKELVESTAKVVLTERGLPVDDKADLPALAQRRNRLSACTPQQPPSAPTAATR